MMLQATASCRLKSHDTTSIATIHSTRQGGTMSALAKDYGHDEDSIDIAHVGRPSTTEDEDISLLLSSREPSEKHRATNSAPRSQLIILSLSISNVITIATVLLFVLSYQSSAGDHKAPTTVIYPPQPKWFPPQSTFHTYLLTVRTGNQPAATVSSILHSTFPVMIYQFTNIVIIVPVTKVMHGNKLFGQPPSPESIEAWNSLLPSE